MTTIARCGECQHYDNAGRICLNDGKLSGISLTDQLETAEHDCPKYKEILYVATPKGLLAAALMSVGVSLELGILDTVWASFVSGMERCGYIESEGGENKE